MKRGSKIKNRKISISEEIYQALVAQRRGMDTFDSVIRRLLQAAERLEQEEREHQERLQADEG